jgi:hypothetical protein
LVGRTNATHNVSRNTVTNNNRCAGAGISGLAVLGANNSNFFRVVNNVGWNHSHANAGSDDLFAVGVVSSKLFGRLSCFRLA